MTDTINSSVCGEIIIGEGSISLLKDKIAEYFGTDCRGIIVSDRNIAPFWLEKVKNACGCKCFEYIIEPGESSKNPDVLFSVLNYMAECGLNRNDFAVALGGGVVGDLTGLAASLYMRGIPVVQLPASLLAAVDSSIGGKTGIDLTAGKNLVGTFNMPVFSIFDSGLLSTLPEREMSEGMAEIIKYGAIKDENLFESLEDGEPDINRVIYRCASIKAELVEKDPFDRGERRLLNFGHTFGHAIEKLSDYKISHGTAVAQGMVIAARISAERGLCPEEVSDRIAGLCEKYGLCTECKYSYEELMSVIRSSDKKKTANGINLILLKKIGEGICLYDSFSCSEKA